MTVPARDDLPFDDLTDFENADRGFIAALDPPVITDAEAQIVYDGNAYAFLDEDCPDTAHPSLWRQSQLCARHGLYEVTETATRLLRRRAVGDGRDDPRRRGRPLGQGRRGLHPGVVARVWHGA
ncbi:hypothetical protein ABZV25_14810 [Micrococcus luteus]